jgi:hypothetical protein
MFRLRTISLCRLAARADHMAVECGSVKSLRTAHDCDKGRGSKDLMTTRHAQRNLHRAVALLLVFGLGPWAFVGTILCVLSLDTHYLAMAGP